MNTIIVFAILTLTVTLSILSNGRHIRLQQTVTNYPNLDNSSGGFSETNNEEADFNEKLSALISPLKIKIKRNVYTELISEVMGTDIVILNKQYLDLIDGIDKSVKMAFSKMESLLGSSSEQFLSSVASLILQFRDEEIKLETNGRPVNIFYCIDNTISTLQELQLKGMPWTIELVTSSLESSMGMSLKLYAQSYKADEDSKINLHNNFMYLLRESAKSEGKEIVDRIDEINNNVYKNIQKSLQLYREGLQRIFDNLITEPGQQVFIENEKNSYFL